MKSQPFSKEQLMEVCEELAFKISSVLANNEKAHDEGIIAYMQNFIARLDKQRNARKIEIYTTALNSFKRFTNGEDIAFSHITGTLMEEYESALQLAGLKMNTSSFYLRTLKAVYNRAVNAGITPDHKPFKRVYTGIARTVKRAISAEEMSRIRTIDIKDDEVRFARDMFMFSFYTQGMSFVDMAYLKPSDLKGNHLFYRRKKTGQELMVRWSQAAQEILDLYPPCNYKYLLPIIKKPGDKERNQYRYKQYVVSQGLKIISDALEMNSTLTMYVARHSWASIAQLMDISTADISRSMGHDSEKTTKIYLRNIDTSSIDDANDRVINAICSGCTGAILR